MHVNGLGPRGPRGSEGPKGARPSDGPEPPHGGLRRNGAEPGHEASPDRVEISAEARALSVAETGTEGERVGLLPQLVVRMRGRLAANYYDRPEVMAETARRLLASGDLQELR